MASRLIKEKEQQKLQDTYMEVDKETGKLVLSDKVDTTLLPNLDNIVDANGNKRFVDINGRSAYTAEGFEITYAKASLSGTHLLIVLAGSVTSGVTVPTNLNIIKYTLPSYVYDKIIPLWASVFIEEKSIVYKNDQWGSQSQRVALAKDGNNTLIIRTIGDLTLSNNANFRLEFDLLIDSE